MAQSSAVVNMTEQPEDVMHITTTKDDVMETSLGDSGEDDLNRNLNDGSDMLDEEDLSDALDEEQNSTIVHDSSLVDDEHLATGNDSMDMDLPSIVSTQSLLEKRNFVCQICTRAFKRSSHLKEHLLTHSEGGIPKKIKQTPHKCPTCFKAFQKPSQLERHIRVHTGERPFHCDMCHKAFNQKNALQIHQKKHTGEKLHKCPYCDVSFIQKGNLKTHIKRAHHVDMVHSMNLPKNLVPAAGATVCVTMESTDSNPVPDEGLNLEEVAELFAQ